MTSRISNSRDSDRVQTRTGVANAECIRSGDVSNALTESSSPRGSDGRDRPPKKAKTSGSDHRLVVPGDAAVAKQFHWQFSHLKDCPITEDPDSVANLVGHFKPDGCLLPSLRNMTEREAYVEMVVAHAKAMEANNEFAATLEKRLQDVPRSGELNEIKKVVRELKLGLKMAQDRERANDVQLAAAEKLGNQAATLEARLRVVSNKRRSALEQVSILYVAASRNDKEIESIGSEIKRLSKELEAIKREGREDAEKIEALTEDWKRVHLENKALESQIVAQRARIAALEVEWASKKNETSAEIRLLEVVANIDPLIELKDGGLTVDAELSRLKEMERDCADLLASATVPDWSIYKLDLPQVSDDPVYQVGGSSVPDDSASS
ncbi:hypothetical protein F2Q70_00025337 [Brassica cretica]|uniref:Uncharacterized protein n=1 Tax=Brassica cretica TaxID=69181 RepID=A0A8S9L5R5_BRACR|nr:hypothetical protein F2Q70_00025337 [Brassica cretica]